MEELLNKLVEKGYCPRGVKDVNVIVYNGIIKVEYRDTYQMYHIRELVSKESGLWQFVCENGLVEIEYGKIREKYDETKDKVITFRNLLGEDNYEYRLIESALTDESELEQFLLDNIKIDG